MGFWIFMLVCCLLLPAVMMLFGVIFTKHPPRKINPVYGYRTARSMKTPETWEFAHKYCGKMWKKAGLILLPLSLLAMLPVVGKSEDVIGIWGCVMLLIQMVPMIASLVLTERALAKHFDRGGNPLQ